MPIPGVSDYIPDTAGDFSAGVGLARQIQANRQAAFERQQQQAQLAAQKEQHQQQVVSGLLEHGIDPVTTPNGTIDVPGSIALKKKKELARSNGAIAALNDLSPAPEDVNDEDFLAGYVPVKQARDRQQLLNEARQRVAEEQTNRAIQQQTLRNSGAVDVQGLRNEGSRTAAEIRAKSAQDAIELKNRLNPDFGFTPEVKEVTGPNGTVVPVITTSKHHVQVLPRPEEATKKLQDKMGFEEFKQGLQSIQFLPKEQQDAALAALHQKFATKPAALAPAAPVTFSNKEDVSKAFKAGQIDRATAAKILNEKFGVPYGNH